VVLISIIRDFVDQRSRAPRSAPRGQETISATVIKRPIWPLVTPNQPSSRKLYHDVALLGRRMRRLVLWWRKHSSECVRERAGFHDVDPTATLETNFCLSERRHLNLLWLLCR
jgi:hypothetical protein